MSDDPQLTLVRQVESLLGDRFGGVWTERGVYHVSVVHPTRSDEATIRGVAPPGLRIDVHEAKYPYGELARFSSLASTRLSQEGVPFASVAPDARTGRVVIVTATPEANLRAALSSSIPEDSFIVKESGGTWVAARSE